MERTSHAWAQVSEIKIVYKPKLRAAERPCITTSEQAYRILLGSWNGDTIDYIEEFKILLLNRANRVLGLVSISTGGMTGTVADPKVIFGAALKASACGIICCHNHPSENLTPSRGDEEVTAKLAAAGKLLDIKVLDHLIIHRTGYMSFADEGRL